MAVRGHVHDSHSPGGCGGGRGGGLEGREEEGCEIEVREVVCLELGFNVLRGEGEGRAHYLFACQ